MYNTIVLFIPPLRKNNVHVAVIDKGSGFPAKLLNHMNGEILLTDMAPMVSKNTIVLLFNSYNQCWGKLLLKVMHYNIALLPKKVTNYVT